MSGPKPFLALTASGPYRPARKTGPSDEQPTGSACMMPGMSPAVQVRRTLEAARRAGVPFGDAWYQALQTIADERWAEALAQTSDTWRRAYALEPRRHGDVAIDLLSRGLAGELANLDADTRCPVCDGVVQQPVKGQQRVYCSSAA